MTRALQRIEAVQAAGPRTADAVLPAGAGPAAAPKRLPDVALVAPPPSSTEGRMLRMEGMILDLTASLKRPHSPTSDTRTVRAHIEDAPLEVLATHVAYSAPPGIVHAAPAVWPPAASTALFGAPPAVAPLLAPAVTPPSAVFIAPSPAAPPALPPVAAPSFIAAPASTGILAAPSSIAAPTSTGIFVAPVTNRRGKTTAPTVCYSAREVRMGPGVWSRDITAQASMIIQAVLPGYNWDKCDESSFLSPPPSTDAPLENLERMLRRARQRYRRYAALPRLNSVAQAPPHAAVVSANDNNSQRLTQPVPPIAVSGCSAALQSTFKRWDGIAKAQKIGPGPLGG
ncbi:hypothetical protein B0H13DRAFT_1864651 [Mycena leptocephala]|nr:hypothetical protein B0H13DRAFT_1864651 [Mycena leptocephala]